MAKEYVIRRLDEAGEAVYISRCSMSENRVKLKTTRDANRAQLFKKEFAETVLAVVSYRWTARKFVASK